MHAQPGKGSENKDLLQADLREQVQRQIRHMPSNRHAFKFASLNTAAGEGQNCSSQPLT